MGLTRFVLVCVLWLIDLSQGSNHHLLDYAPSTTIQDGVEESRGRHRLQLLFPLLLRISTRLATLVPTAMMALLGIYLFVAFSKKAFIVSLLALFLTVAHKFKSEEKIYIHKIDSYPEYNNDEEHFYYHKWYPKGNPYYRTHKKNRKNLRRASPSASLEPYAIPIRTPARGDESFKKPDFNEFLEEGIRDPVPEPDPLSFIPEEVLESPGYSKTQNAIGNWSPITY